MTTKNSGKKKSAAGVKSQRKSSQKSVPAKRFAKTKKVATAVTKTTKKMVDQVLLKVSPGIETKIQQLGQSLQNSPLNVDHLKLLGFKVLEKAKVMSAGFRTEKAKKTAAKIVKSKRVAS